MGRGTRDAYLLERVDDAVGRVLVEALDAGPVDEVDQIHLPARYLHGHGRAGGRGGHGGGGGGGYAGGVHGLGWLPETSGRAGRVVGIGTGRGRLEEGRICYANFAFRRGHRGPLEPPALTTFAKCNVGCFAFVRHNGLF